MEVIFPIMLCIQFLSCAIELASVLTSCKILILKHSQNRKTKFLPILILTLFLLGRKYRTNKVFQKMVPILLIDYVQYQLLLLLVCCLEPNYLFANL